MVRTRRPLNDRFWEQVTKGWPDGCWLWSGTTTSYEYGSIGAGGRGGENLLAHRVSWELHNGPIPSGDFVLHRCDQPLCVNPTHLRLGSQADNMADAAAKGRMPRGPRHWNSKLSEGDVRQIRRLDAQGLDRKEIAKRFGVSRSNVDVIMRGVSWAWLN